MKEKCPLCGNDKEPTGMQLLCHPPITEVACRKCQPGKFPYISFDVKRHDEAALKQPVWNGTGLPPVGVECEGKQFAQLNWTKFKVVAVENGHVFGFWNDSVSVGLNSKLWQFRPIRSKRDEAVDKIVEVLSIGKNTEEDAANVYQAIAAGKIPGVKLSD